MTAIQVAVSSSSPLGSEGQICLYFDSLQVFLLGLPELIVDGFDVDQIWAELELYNKPFLSKLNSYSEVISSGVAQVTNFTLPFLYQYGFYSPSLKI